MSKKQRTRRTRKVTVDSPIENYFIPKPCIIEKVFVETADTKTFRVKFPSFHEPGQFVQVSLLGIGECPISICSYSNDFIEICIRNVGNVTNSIHSLKEKDKIGIRGPYGSYYPMKRFAGKKLIIIGGGSGVAPLRGVIKYLEKNLQQYASVKILLGFRNPDEIIFRKEMEKWSNLFDMKVTVDEKKPGWTGDVGLITKLVERSKINPENSAVILCGPPIMIRFVLKSLKNMGFPDEDIWMSLERQMKCGIGKCGHCMIEGKFVCKDGPVMNYTDAKKLAD